MLVTFGKTVVSIQSGESKSEFMCCLSQCDLGSRLLGKDPNSKHNLY